MADCTDCTTRGSVFNFDGLNACNTCHHVYGITIDETELPKILTEARNPHTGNAFPPLKKRKTNSGAAAVGAAATAQQQQQPPQQDMSPLNNFRKSLEQHLGALFVTITERDRTEVIADCMALYKASLEAYTRAQLLPKSKAYMPRLEDLRVCGILLLFAASRPNFNASISRAEILAYFKEKSGAIDFNEQISNYVCFLQEYQVAYLSRGATRASYENVLTAFFQSSHYRDIFQQYAGIQRHILRLYNHIMSNVILDGRGPHVAMYVSVLHIMTGNGCEQARIEEGSETYDAMLRTINVLPDFKARVIQHFMVTCRGESACKKRPVSAAITDFNNRHRCKEAIHVI